MRNRFLFALANAIGLGIGIGVAMAGRSDLAFPVILINVFGLVLNSILLLNGLRGK